MSDKLDSAIAAELILLKEGRVTEAITFEENNRILAEGTSEEYSVIRKRNLGLQEVSGSWPKTLTLNEAIRYAKHVGYTEPIIGNTIELINGGHLEFTYYIEHGCGCCGSIGPEILLKVPE